MTNNFYSSLVISSKRFADVHQVFKPRYNKEYFKRLTANFEQLENQTELRCKNIGSPDTNYSLKSLKNDFQDLFKLKVKLERVDKDDCNKEAELLAIRSQLEELEEKLMPLVVSLPNRTSKQVPSQETVVNQLQSSYRHKEKLSKLLNHTKLSYINNCYSKSVVGPNSHFYYGIGAKLQHGLDEFFTSELGNKNFVPVSGLCLTKSAVVEAANSREVKEYTTDPCRILTKDQSYTTRHIVEASRESLVGFLTTLGHRPSKEPLRLMSSGAGYRIGREWFDSDDKRVAQFPTLCALIQCPSIEQCSMKEYADVKETIWKIYAKLGLPTRLVHCSIKSMFINEYDAHRIDVWLPSRQEWIQTGRISHYHDFITIRTGLKRGHIIDSSVYDGQALAAAIIENNQTSTGRFIIPQVLKDYMIELTKSEKEEYFEDSNSSFVDDEIVLNRSLLNFNQRRYLVKRSYVLSHSRKAEKMRLPSQRISFYILLSFVGSFSLIIDWEEVYILYVPKSVKAFSYDNIYRPIRRVWWYIVFGSKGLPKPQDLSFAELDLSSHEKTIHERRREEFFKYQTPVSESGDSRDK